MTNPLGGRAIRRVLPPGAPGHTTRLAFGATLHSKSRIVKPVTLLWRGS